MLSSEHLFQAQRSQARVGRVFQEPRLRGRRGEEAQGVSVSADGVCGESSWVLFALFSFSQPLPLSPRLCSFVWCRNPDPDFIKSCPIDLIWGVKVECSIIVVAPARGKRSVFGVSCLRVTAGFMRFGKSNPSLMLLSWRSHGFGEMTPSIRRGYGLFWGGTI